MTAASPTLLDVLPPDLFGPLASQNRRQYWRLLEHLHARFFGLEAEQAPPSGWLLSEVVDAVEQLIEHTDRWDSEEGDDNVASSANQRAHNDLRRLIKAGWLLEEQVGLAKVVSMPEVVSKFFDTLNLFVEQALTPNQTGAKMRSIESDLARVASSSQPGDDLDQAASQARQLVGAMSSMGLRVREVMRMLTADVTTAEAIKRIFDDYIAKTYVGDYARLAGVDHPLARKSAVLALANGIAYGPQRDRLIAWYAQQRTGGDVTAAQAHFDRTIARIKRLDQIQDYLDRLEDDMRRMNRRMLALIDYRLHAPSHLDIRISRAITGVRAADAPAYLPPIGPGQLLDGGALYKPPKRRKPIPIEADRVRMMSPEHEAKMRLRARARHARLVMTADIYRFLDAAIGNKGQLLASQLPIGSVKEFRIVQTLAGLALASMPTADRPKRSGVHPKLPRYSFTGARGKFVRNGYFDMRDFYITKVG